MLVYVPIYNKIYMYLYTKKTVFVCIQFVVAAVGQVLWNNIDNKHKIKHFMLVIVVGVLVAYICCCNKTDNYNNIIKQ